ncbi:hypothetical protein JKP88DRAFT_219574, partial [Tribonema minus]
LSVALAPRVMAAAVSVAHEAGDAAAADALWREAGGAAYFGLYKVLVPPKEGSDGGWTVLVDQAVRRQPHAQNTALDLSSCNDGVMHAALRAEAWRLRAQPASAVSYVYTGTFTAHRQARATALRELMGAAGVQTSLVHRTPGLFSVSVRAPEQAPRE